MPKAIPSIARGALSMTHDERRDNISHVLFPRRPIERAGKRALFTCRVPYCERKPNTDNETAKQRAVFLETTFGKLALRCIVLAAAA